VRGEVKLHAGACSLRSRPIPADAFTTTILRADGFVAKNGANKASLLADRFATLRLQPTYLLAAEVLCETNFFASAEERLEPNTTKLELIRTRQIESVLNYNIAFFHIYMYW
jgi:hypothetical protein